MNVLSIDYGERRIGIATGDFSMKIAFPRGVIINYSREHVFEKISELISELEISLIIVGLPLHMEDQTRYNRILEIVNKFVAALKDKVFPIEVKMIDERLSSFEADTLIDDAHEKGDKADLGRDAYAAQVILQRFFDKN